MKKHIFFLSIIILFTRGEGQVVFCPAGAEWHYSFYQNTLNSTSNQKIKYLKDTIMGSETVKVLLSDSYYNPFCIYTPAVRILIKQKGDTVFMRSITTQNTWQILYNFAATSGQTWTNTINSTVNTTLSLTYTVTVDSANFITINNFVLKNLYATYRNSGNIVAFDNVRITERFGCDRFMFNYRSPYSSTEWIYFQNFLCYQDDTFGLKQFTNYNCDRSNVGIAKNYRNVNIQIYPNPVNDIFTINFEEELITGDSFVSIKDLTGREIKQVEISDLNHDKIDISDIAKGVYILNLSNNNEIVYTGKLVKSD